MSEKQAQRQAEFLEDLKALLRKHRAEVSLDDTSFGYTPWPELTVSLDTIKDENGEVAAPYTYFTLFEGFGTEISYRD